LLLSKFTTDGILEWTNVFGGNKAVEGYSVIETKFRELVVTGYSANDTLLAKFSSHGKLIWATTLAPNNPAWGSLGWSVVESSDGGFVVTGETFPTSNIYESSALVAKFDSSGTFVWIQMIEGNNNARGYSVMKSSDEGLVITGSTTSYGAGYEDILLVKIPDSETSDCAFVVTNFTANTNVAFEQASVSPNITSPAIDSKEVRPSKRAIRPISTVVCDDTR